MLKERRSRRISKRARARVGAAIVLASALCMAGCAWDREGSPPRFARVDLAMVVSPPLDDEGTVADRPALAQRMLGCDACRTVEHAGAAGHAARFVLADAPHARLTLPTDVERARVREVPRLRSGAGSYFTVLLDLGPSAPEALRETGDLVPLWLSTSIGDERVGIEPVFENADDEIRVAWADDRDRAIEIASRFGPVVVETASGDALEQRRRAQLDLLADLYRPAKCEPDSQAARALLEEFSVLAGRVPELVGRIDCDADPGGPAAP